MSVYQNQTSATPYDSFFISNTDNVNIRSTINVYDGTINAYQINLDAIQMDCAYIGPASTATLLLNGLPVAATSSFTSSITSWSQYPAVAPITYTGGGGTANLNNVNALTAVSTATVQAGTINATTAVNASAMSTATLAVSTINGAAFPSSITPARTITGDQIISGINYFVVDFAGLTSGFYMVEVYIGSGGLDPFSCSATVKYSGGQVVGGSFHCPSLINAPPTLANCVSIQDDGNGSTELSVIVQTNNDAAIGAVPQISLYRLT